MVQKYPNFANRVHQALVDIFGEKGKKIVTHHAEDGSGVGSAIIAGQFFDFWSGLVLMYSHDQSAQGQGFLYRLLGCSRMIKVDVE